MRANHVVLKSEISEDPANSAGIGSSSIISFTIPGKPCAWERSRHNGKIHFDSKKQVSNKGVIQMYASAAYRGEPIDTAIILSIRAFFYPSKKMLKKRPSITDVEGICYTSYPDNDNICKLVQDALNGVIWADDRRIADIHVYKRYSLRPRTEIIVEW